MEHIKKVFVIHKTHLDIGFTALAQDVMDMYTEKFIPQAIETAYECNKDGKKNFVWTVASFIIDYYLEHSKEPEKLIRAIEDGYIVWHALPLTSHTELMDAELFQFGIDLGKRLDKRFGKKTIAAKMTDVPCHTHAIVPFMAKNDLQYLHIGINESSSCLDIPSLCRLRYGNDEIVLNYAKDYGMPEIFGDIALEFAHTADNMGPPTVEGVFAEMARLHEKYPNAEIVSASLDDFAKIVLPEKDKMPVVDCELGDTWIHGSSTDPYKIGLYRELLRMKEAWKALDPNAPQTENYDRFMKQLLLVCEHTCGLDIKKWLYDFKNYTKEDFRAAREKGATGLEELKAAGELITNFVLEQQRVYTGGEMKGSYQVMEQSWEEQRKYVYNAIALLPDALRAKMEEKMASLRPETLERPANETDARDFTIAGYHIEVLEDGSLRLLADNTGRTYENAYLGRMLYQVFSAKTVENCYNTYNRRFAETRGWSEPDFAKPGLAAVEGLTDETYAYTVRHVAQEGNTLIVCLLANEEASATYGAPRRARVTYTFGDEIAIKLEWAEKDASRIPEAVFFGFNFDCTDEDKLTVEKLGLPVQPYNVCSRGNRKLHACSGVRYGDATIENVHSALLSVGGLHLYDTDDTYGPIENGLYFVLSNNRWNTNFPLWYGQNAAFEYIVRLH